MTDALFAVVFVVFGVASWMLLVVMPLKSRSRIEKEDRWAHHVIENRDPSQRAIVAYRRRYVRGEISLECFEELVESALVGDIEDERGLFSQSAYTEQVSIQLPPPIAPLDAESAYRADHKKVQDRIDRMERGESA